MDLFYLQIIDNQQDWKWEEALHIPKDIIQTAVESLDKNIAYHLSEMEIRGKGKTSFIRSNQVKYQYYRTHAQDQVGGWSVLGDKS